MDEPKTESLFGADVMVFEDTPLADKDEDVSITGTDAGFADRSLVRNKGVEDDWLKTNFK